VAFLDSDDEWLPTQLERQFSLVMACSPVPADVVICQKSTAGPSGRQDKAPVGNAILDLHDVATQRLGGVGSSLFLRRRILSASGVRFDESLPAAQDWDFLFRLAMEHRIHLLNERLVRVYRTASAGDHVWSGERIVIALRLLRIKYAEYLAKTLAVRSGWDHRLARLHVDLGDIRAARKYFGAALAAQPWRPRLWFLWGATWLGTGGFRRTTGLYRAVFRRLTPRVSDHLIRGDSRVVAPQDGPEFQP